jgi:hypothetical protein
MKAAKRTCGYALICLVAGLFPSFAFATAPAKVVVGVFPTYDQAGESFGQPFSQHLTAIMFRELQDSPVEPVLLNPGGIYTPVEDEWINDYAQKNDIDLALVTVLLKTDIPKKGDATLQVKAELLDVKSGKPVASWQSTVPINRHELFLEHGFFRSSRPFEKQPLGGAARKIATDIRDRVVGAASSVNSTREAPAPVSSTASCNIGFKVAYVSKHSISKSYDVIVNGKDETLSIVDGNLPLALRSGPLLLQLAVHDSPYKLPKQELYQVNTQVDCSQGQHDLSFEIGAAGEGFLKWQ